MVPRLGGIKCVAISGFPFVPTVMNVAISLIVAQLRANSAAIDRVEESSRYIAQPTEYAPSVSDWQAEIAAIDRRFGYEIVFIEGTGR